MQQRTIGARSVSAIGLGGMPMSIEGRPETERSVATIHAALEAGVTLIDTADAYHRDANDVGHNEELIASALRSYGSDTSDVLVATKGGHLRPGDGSWTKNGRPEYLKEAAKASARRLGVEAIGLYQFHRPDPERRLRRLGGRIWRSCSTRASSSSPASPTPRSRRSTWPTSCWADAWSRSRTSSPRPSPRAAGELDHCAELGIAFLPWSPLGGIGRTASVGESHPAFLRLADERGVSLQQVILAWELALAPVVIPIPGSSRPASITDSAAAADLELSAADVASLTDAVSTEASAVSA